MLRYLARHIFWGLVTLFLFITVMFFLVQLLLPHDFTAQFALSMNAEQRMALQHSLGLDLPLWRRYLNWLWDVIHLDLGQSFYGLPVVDVLKRALTFTLLLFVPGTAVAFLLGYWLGKWMSWRLSGPLPSIVTLLSLAFYASFPPWIAYLVTIVLVPRIRPFVRIYNDSINRWLYAADVHIYRFPEIYSANPITFVAYMLMSVLVAGLVLLIFHRLLLWRFGRALPRGLNLALLIGSAIISWQAFGFWSQAIAILYALAIPMVTYVLLIFAEPALIMRASMEEVQDEEYINTANAKGLPDRVVRDTHAARNAILPVISRLVINLPYFLTGVVVVEGVFRWPGLGYTVWRAISDQDVLLMMGLLLVIGLVSLLARLTLDVLHAYLDPRVRFDTTRRAAHSRERVNMQWFDIAAVRLAMRNEGRVKRWRRGVKLAWGRAKRAGKVFSQSKLALLGVGILGLFFTLIIARPILFATVWPSGVYDPVTGYDFAVRHPAMPSWRHPLGTQIKGLDVLSILMVATQRNFTLGLVAGLTAAIIGTVLGVWAAYGRGRTDAILSRLFDVFLLIPAPIFMAFAGAGLRGAGPLALGLIYGVIAGMGTTAILMRTYALTIVARPYIEVAQIAGGSAGHVIRRHVLPHLYPMAALQMLVAVTGAVVVDAFLGYLPETGWEYASNWGTMLLETSQLEEFLGIRTPWHAILPPVIAFFLFGLAIFLISRGLQRVANPRFTRRQV